MTNTTVLRYAGLQPQELILEPSAIDGVDRPERLVHQHQWRVRGKGTRDADALALPTGELRGIPLADLVGIHPDQVQKLGHSLGNAALAPAQQPGDSRDVLRHGLMREQADLLDHIPNLPAELVRLPAEHAPSSQQDVAARQRKHPVDQPHRGCLA